MNKPSLPLIWPYIKLAIKAGAILMLLGLNLPRAFAATFPDVPSSHDNFMAIEDLSKKGIIKGYPDNTFQPEREVNRAEALAIILKGLNIEIPPEIQMNEVIFPDVKTDSWFYPFVMNGWRLAIVKGYSDNTFKPGQTVNLVESLKMIITAAGVTIADTKLPNLYKGLDNTAWYAPYANFAESKNLIQAGDDGLVHPDAKITRGELAELVYRFLKVRENNGQAFDLTLNWYTYENPLNNYQIKYPRGWEVHKGTKNTTFWKRDYLNKQIWYTRLYLNSGRISVSYFDNPDKLTAVDFFKNIKEKNSKIFGELQVAYTEKSINNLSTLRVSVSDKHVLDFYVYLPNNKILVFYGEWGNGPLGRDLAKHIGLVYDSFLYVAENTENSGLNTIQEKLEHVRENLLVENKGQEILNLFSDRQLIETDIIGVGTGPVDYYYTQEGDITLKYERASNTILDIQNGNTTMF